MLASSACSAGQPNSGAWEHVVREHNSNTVFVHPTNSNIVLAGTHDGVYRSTDRGKTFKRANFPDKNMEIWSFLVTPAIRS